MASGRRDLVRLSSSPRQQVDAILLDFRSLPHHRLAVKFRHYGIRDKNLTWIKSFLADRNQQSKKKNNDQELIQSDSISCPQNQKGNN